MYEADGASGRLIRSCPLSTNPQAVAVEAGSDRVVVVGYSRNEVAAVDLTGCRVVQRVAAVPQPIGVAVDGADGRLAIESSDDPPAPPPGGQPAMPTTTTVTIVTLTR